MKAALAATFLLAACASTEERIVVRTPATPALVYEQASLPGGGIDELERTDDAAWRSGSDGDRTFVELFASSDYAPPHRSPRSIALLPVEIEGDFTLELDALQTGREYGHRDLCLFFDYQSPTRYYYTHLATSPDQNAHNVFLVDDAPRRNLLPPQKTGIDWGDGWHRLRLEREGDAIRVYFDDMQTPVLEVSDATLRGGRVGVGSFDDTGRFANIELRVPAP